jgi:hypothetical protein
MNQLVRMAQMIAEREAEAEIPEVSDPEGAPLNAEHLRMLEAILFAAALPLDAPSLAASLPQGADVGALLAELRATYEHRGVNLVQVAGKWQFRTAPDLAFLLRKEQPEQKRLSRAAIETLAIVARCAPRGRMDQDPGPQTHPGPACDLRNHRSFSCAIRAGKRRTAAGHGGAEGGGISRCRSAGEFRRAESER